jgi:hypothetical protein
VRQRRHCGWYSDGNRGIEKWADGDWTGHAHLLRLLRTVRCRPRVEHIAREDFRARWDRAQLSRKLPDLITATDWAGLIRELQRDGRLIVVRSERLTWMTEVASCADFRGRFLYLVAGSPHEVAGRRAVDELLRPAPETRLPGRELAEAGGRTEAVQVASRAVAAYIAGDPQGLRDVASASSPQLSRCTRPPEYLRGRVVDAGEVELRGSEAVAFARVEMRFRSETAIGADPIVAVLSREGSRWKAFGR